MAEAASVCLDERGHQPDTTTLMVDGIQQGAFVLEWSSPSDQQKRTWGDPDEATEQGACGIAILLALECLGFTVVKRSRKGTGFDYWLGHSNVLPFQDKARLEVSGIRVGNDRGVLTRVGQKIKQTEQSRHTELPAYAIVVEFGKPQALIEADHDRH